MRNNKTNFVVMASNVSNTYQIAKQIFETLELKEDIVIHIDYKDLPLFRKHLSEMIKRKKSTVKFASRQQYDGSIKVIRIE